MIYSYIITGYFYFVFLFALYKYKSKSEKKYFNIDKISVYKKNTIYDLSRSFDNKIYYQNINLQKLLNVIKVNIIYKKKFYVAEFLLLNKHTLVSSLKIKDSYIYLNITSKKSKITFKLINKKALNLLVSINIKLKNKCYHIEKRYKKTSIYNNKNIVTFISNTIIKKANIIYRKKCNKLNILIKANKDISMLISNMIDIVYDSACCNIDKTRVGNDSTSMQLATNHLTSDKKSGVDIAINKLKFDIDGLPFDYNKIKDKAISEYNNQKKPITFSQYLNECDIDIFDGFSNLYIQKYCLLKKQYCLFLKYLLTKILGIKFKNNDIVFLKLNANISYIIKIKNERIFVKRKYYNLDVIRNKILFRNISLLKI